MVNGQRSKKVNQHFDQLTYLLPVAEVLIRDPIVFHSVWYQDVVDLYMSLKIMYTVFKRPSRHSDPGHPPGRRLLLSRPNCSSVLA